MRLLRKFSAPQIRLALYTLVIAPLSVTLVYDYSKDGISHQFAFLAALSIVAIAAILEIYLFLRRNASTTTFCATQLSLYSHLLRTRGMDVAEIIRGSESIDILCDTLKSFTDDESRIKALNHAIDNGKRVRILALDPESPAIGSLCEARNARKGGGLDCADLQLEIKHSLRRIEQVFGPSKARLAVRRYSHYPTCAIYRFGDDYMVCTYTFGRGGSSPAMFLSMSDSNAGYCAGLNQAFEELWNASTTTALRPG